MTLRQRSQLSQMKNLFTADKILPLLPLAAQSQISRSATKKETEDLVVNAINRAMQDKFSMDDFQGTDRWNLITLAAIFTTAFNNYLGGRKLSREEEADEFIKFFITYSKRIKTFIENQKLKPRFKKEQIIANFPESVKETIQRLSEQSKNGTQDKFAEVILQAMNGPVDVEILFANPINWALVGAIPASQIEAIRRLDSEKKILEEYQAYFAKVAKQVQNNIKFGARPKLRPMDVYINLPSEVRINLDRAKIADRNMFLNMVMKAVYEEFRASQLSENEEVVFAMFLSENDLRKLQNAGDKKNEVMDKIMEGLAESVNKNYIKEVIAKGSDPSFSELSMQVSVDDIFRQLSDDKKKKLNRMDPEEKGTVLTLIQKFLGGKFPMELTQEEQLTVYTAGDDEDKEKVKEARGGPQRMAAIKAIIAKFAADVTKESG